MRTTAEGRRQVEIDASVDALLERVQQRESWKNSDSLSGSRLERGVADGVPCVIKYLSVDDDFIMRATGDLHCRQLTMLQSHVLDDLPPQIDDTLIACAPFTTVRGHRGAALLMRDESRSMVPAGSEPIAFATHRMFLEHMAAMHSAFWEFHDDIGLMPLAHHYTILTPTMAEIERQLGNDDQVPQAVRHNWARLHREHPDDAAILQRLADDPAPLVRVLGARPQTLVHADWKLGNLGETMGRTVLLDWDRTGQGSPLIDLAWYLAVNCDRLPETKESALDAYRDALESSGVDTGSWWHRHLALALAGAFLQQAWTKLDDGVEYNWWSSRLHSAVGRL